MKAGEEGGEREVKKERKGEREVGGLVELRLCSSSFLREAMGVSTGKCVNR